MKLFDTKQRILSFSDPYMRFKLSMNFIFAIAISFVTPIVTYLKGVEFKDIIWLIPFFAFLGTLVSKNTEFLVKKLTIQQVHKMSLIVTALFTLTPFLYLWDGFYTALITSFLAIIDTTLAVVGSIFFTNYVTVKNPLLISKYQTNRVHVFADGAIIGGVLALLVTKLSNNIIYVMWAEVVVDVCITYLFIINYKLIENLREEDYKIKEMEDENK